MNPAVEHDVFLPTEEGRDDAGATNLGPGAERYELEKLARVIVVVVVAVVVVLLLFLLLLLFRGRCCRHRYASLFSLLLLLSNGELNWKIGSSFLKSARERERERDKAVSSLASLRKENNKNRQKARRKKERMNRTSAFQRLVAEHRPQEEEEEEDEATTHHHHHHRAIGNDERIRFAKAVVTSARNALSLAKATATAIEHHQLETYFDHGDVDGIVEKTKSSSLFLDGIGGVKTSRRKGTISGPSKTKDIEAARDSIEREIVECIRECQKHVDRCEALIASGWNSSSSSSSSWATLKLKHALVAHLHGVALIASERIEEVAKTLDAMRARRFREQAEKARQLERRRGGDERVGVEAVAKDLMRRRVVKGRTSGDVGESSNNSFSQQQQQQQEFVNDSEALVAELVEISRGTQRAESKIVELSALSSMFANVVSKQSQQIERVYAEALKSTKFLEVGNVEMRKTISRRRSGSSYMAFVFFVATFAVLFLDWFND